MVDAVPRETPLVAVHEWLGATFTTFAGWRMPLRYSGHLREHEAVRTAGGLFDLSHMGELEVTGPAAVDFLDYALLVHASAIEVGRARHTVLLTPAGGVIDDLVVYRLGAERFLVVANAANVAVVTDALSARRTGFDATVRDTSDDYALVSLQGPRAVEVLAPLTTTDLGLLKYYNATKTEVAGRPALLARTGYTGEIGFEIFVAVADGERVWTVVQAAGDTAGVVPAGLAARDTLRLEAGMPLYDNELTREVTPLHAGLTYAMPKDKPVDYVGRAALAKYADGTPTVLVGLAGTGRRAARSGCPVLDPATGEVIGSVTSGVLSPTLGYPIAMAYVPAAYQAPGTVFDVDVRGSILPMHVVERPFYKRLGGR